MEKLTLEHIAPFLPYGVLVKTGDLERQRSIVFNNPTTFHTIRISTLLGGIGHKLILRKMDLTKPITIDGVEIIPIEFLKTGGTNINEVRSRYDDDFGGIVSSCCDNEEHELRYSPRYGFERRYKCEGRALSQLPLFKKLYEWKHDVDGLIEKGLAIDADTLDVNPYNS